MARKRRKPVSFDAMVKYFIRYYEIPTKPDIDHLAQRIDHLERTIRGLVHESRQPSKMRALHPADPHQPPATASDHVFEVIKASNTGIRFAAIQQKTGFAEKKLRNIIYRLNSLGKIRRISRGIYTV